MGMAKLFTELTVKEIGGGLDTVEKASLRIKGLLALVRQSIRIATSYGPDKILHSCHNTRIFPRKVDVYRYLLGGVCQNVYSPTLVE